MMAKVQNSIIHLIKGDITEQDTDAIVNAANSSLMGGGGVDGAIHSKGGKEILEECKLLRRSLPQGLPAGDAVATTGGHLRAKNVIHTVGPIWKGGDNEESEKLARAYRNSLALALNMGIKTISFPSISTGAYGYPVKKASGVALRAVADFLEENAGIDEVRFILHSEYDLRIYEEALMEIMS